MERSELTQKTVKELRVDAEKVGVKHISSLKKEELIDAIIAADAEAKKSAPKPAAEKESKAAADKKSAVKDEKDDKKSAVKDEKKSASLKAKSDDEKADDADADEAEELDENGKVVAKVKKDAKDKKDEKDAKKAEEPAPVAKSPAIVNFITETRLMQWLILVIFAVAARLFRPERCPAGEEAPGRCGSSALPCLPPRSPSPAMWCAAGRSNE